MTDQVKNILNKKKWQGKEIMIVLIIIGIILVVLAIPTEKKETEEEEQNVSVSEEEQGLERDRYEEQLEERLEEILFQMEGVGRVEVMITLEASAREVVEKDISTQQGVVQQENTDENTVSKEETTVYSDTDVGNIPYVVQEIYPEVEGVLVVAEGGDDSYVNLAIVDAIQALFGIDVHKIKIVKMNTN